MKVPSDETVKATYDRLDRAIDAVTDTDDQNDVDHDELLETLHEAQSLILKMWRSERDVPTTEGGG